MAVYALKFFHSYGAGGGARYINMVGEEGIEPSHLAVHDFESCAYTNSATRPCIY